MKQESNPITAGLALGLILLLFSQLSNFDLQALSDFFIEMYL